MQANFKKESAESMLVKKENQIASVKKMMN